MGTIDSAGGPGDNAIVYRKKTAVADYRRKEQLRFCEDRPEHVFLVGHNPAHRFTRKAQ